MSPMVRNNFVKPEAVIEGDVIHVSNHRGPDGIISTYRGKVAKIVENERGWRDYLTREGGLIFRWRFGSIYPGYIAILTPAPVNPEPLFAVEGAK